MKKITLELTEKEAKVLRDLLDDVAGTERPEDTIYWYQMSYITGMRPFLRKVHKVLKPVLGRIGEGDGS